MHILELMQFYAVQLAQALSFGLIVGNISIPMVQQVFGAQQMALLDHPPASQLVQHIYVLTLSHTQLLTSDSTVAKMLNLSQVCLCCQLHLPNVGFNGSKKTIEKPWRKWQEPCCYWQ